jgi:tRNA A37 N6-isopentenylltransferase MiaA
VIVCGGTGLYVRALLLGLFAGPPADPAVRAELDKRSPPTPRSRCGGG